MSEWKKKNERNINEKCKLHRQPFPGGEKVTYTGKEVLCGKCSQIPTKDIDSHSQTSPTSVNGTLTGISASIILILFDLRTSS